MQLCRADHSFLPHLAVRKRKWPHWRKSRSWGTEKRTVQVLAERIIFCWGILSIPNLERMRQASWTYAVYTAYIFFFFFFFCSTKARHPKEFVKFELKNFVNSLCEKCIKSILNFRCLCNKDLGFFYNKSRSRGSNEFCKLQLSNFYAKSIHKLFWPFAVYLQTYRCCWCFSICLLFFLNENYKLRPVRPWLILFGHFLGGLSFESPSML